MDQSRSHPARCVLRQVLRRKREHLVHAVVPDCPVIPSGMRSYVPALSATTPRSMGRHVPYDGSYANSSGGLASGMRPRRRAPARRPSPPPPRCPPGAAAARARHPGASQPAPAPGAPAAPSPPWRGRCLPGGCQSPGARDRTGSTRADAHARDRGGVVAGRGGGVVLDGNDGVVAGRDHGGGGIKSASPSFSSPSVSSSLTSLSPA